MKIEVKHTVLGTHQWSSCPFKEVEFLRNEHHHDFTVRAVLEVNHEDRELEFILVRIELIKAIEKLYPKKNHIVRFGERSCEMISTEIQRELYLVLGQGNFKVNVSEDETYRGGDW